MKFRYITNSAIELEADCIDSEWQVYPDPSYSNGNPLEVIKGRYWADPREVSRYDFMWLVREVERLQELERHAKVVAAAVRLAADPKGPVVALTNLVLNSSLPTEE